MKARIPIAIGIVVLTLLFCLWGPVPRLVFLLLCSLAATWETWTILTKDGHWGYAAILLAFVLACGALSLCHAALLWYAVAFFAAAQLVLALAALTYREGKGRDALMALAALVYPGSLFGTLLAVSQTEHWLWPFAVGQLTAWICDSAAPAHPREPPQDRGGMHRRGHRRPAHGAPLLVPVSGGLSPVPLGVDAHLPPLLQLGTDRRPRRVACEAGLRGQGFFKPAGASRRGHGQVRQHGVLHPFGVSLFEDHGSDVI